MQTLELVRLARSRSEMGNGARFFFSSAVSYQACEWWNTFCLTWDGRHFIFIEILNDLLYFRPFCQSVPDKFDDRC